MNKWTEELMDKKYRDRHMIKTCKKQQRDGRKNEQNR